MLSIGLIWFSWYWLAFHRLNMIFIILICLPSYWFDFHYIELLFAILICFPSYWFAFRRIDLFSTKSICLPSYWFVFILLVSFPSYRFAFHRIDLLSAILICFHHTDFILHNLMATLMLGCIAAGISSLRSIELLLGSSPAPRGKVYPLFGTGQGFPPKHSPVTIHYNDGRCCGIFLRKATIKQIENRK